MPTISYQLYSSRNFPDLARQAAMLAGLGIRQVEPFGGLFADVAPLQAVMARHNLTAPTAHIGIPTLREDFDGAMGKLKALGVQVAIVPAVPPEQRVQPREGWEQLGRELAGWAHRAADHGLKFGWHSHSFEFAQHPDGSFPLEHILADNAAVLWQCDLAWLIRGGQDPAKWIDRYADRITGFHVKDIAPAGECADEDGWADVGQGTIDWPALLPAMHAAHAPVWTLEHDNPNDDRRFASRSFAAVSEWLR